MIDFFIGFLVGYLIGRIRRGPTRVALDLIANDISDAAILLRLYQRHHEATIVNNNMAERLEASLRTLERIKR